jgi:hypothetical protein
MICTYFGNAARGFERKNPDATLQRLAHSTCPGDSLLLSTVHSPTAA